MAPDEGGYYKCIVLLHHASLGADSLLRCFVYSFTTIPYYHFAQRLSLSGPRFPPSSFAICSVMKKNVLQAERTKSTSRVNLGHHGCISYDLSYDGYIAYKLSSCYAAPALPPPLFFSLALVHRVSAMTLGGISKASKGINLSEDIFGGFNFVLRGGKATQAEYIQVGLYALNDCSPIENTSWGIRC